MLNGYWEGMVREQKKLYVSCGTCVRQTGTMINKTLPSLDLQASMSFTLFKL